MCSLPLCPASRRVESDPPVRHSVNPPGGWFGERHSLESWMPGSSGVGERVRSIRAARHWHGTGSLTSLTPTPGPHPSTAACHVGYTWIDGHEPVLAGDAGHSMQQRRGRRWDWRIHLVEQPAVGVLEWLHAVLWTTADSKRALGLRSRWRNGLTGRYCTERHTLMALSPCSCSVPHPHN